MAEIARDAAATGSLVELAASGDRIAFSRIVAAYHPDMVRVAFVVSGGDQDTADDAVQSAWWIAWRRLRSLRDPDRLKPWLVAIAANEARQLVRRRRRSVVSIDVDVGRGIPPGALIDTAIPDPGGRADALDLHAALRHLAPDERALLALRYVAGLDSSEIAGLTGSSPAAVRGRLARLLGRLRKELTDA